MKLTFRTDACLLPQRIVVLWGTKPMFLVSMFVWNSYDHSFLTAIIRHPHSWWAQTLWFIPTASSPLCCQTSTCNSGVNNNKVAIYKEEKSQLLRPISVSIKSFFLSFSCAHRKCRVNKHPAGLCCRRLTMLSGSLVSISNSKLRSLFYPRPLSPLLSLSFLNSSWGSKQWNCCFTDWAIFCFIDFKMWVISSQ